MREPGPRLGSIQTKILLPWLVLTLLVLVLAGYRYYQTQELARMANHSQLHRQATRLAYELSLLTQVQLGNVLAYHATQDPQLIKRFKQREEETDRKIAILTQFNSASLHRHIWSTYTRDQFSPGWLQILAAEQTPRSAD